MELRREKKSIRKIHFRYEKEFSEIPNEFDQAFETLKDLGEGAQGEVLLCRLRSDHSRLFACKVMTVARTTRRETVAAAAAVEVNAI